MEPAACAGRLQAELEALQSIWGRPDFDICTVAAAVVLERISDGLRCSAALPPAYPTCSTAPTVSVLEHPVLARAAITGVNAVLSTVCSERSSAASGDEVGEVLLELFQRALDEVDAAADRANEAARALEADVAKRRGAPCAIRLKRVFIWFHHIKSRTKKRWIVEWSRELGCGGICKPGFPGAMYVEGPAHAVDELVARLKGLPWQAMIVRHEESITVPVAAPGAGAAADGGKEHLSSDFSAESHLWMRLPRVAAALAGEAADADGDGSESDEDAPAKGHDACAAATAGAASRSAGAAGKGAAAAAGGGSLGRPSIRLLPESGLDVMARAMAAVSPAALETFKAAILRL